jgi:hypothetical protein
MVLRRDITEKFKGNIKLVIEKPESASPIESTELLKILGILKGHFRKLIQRELFQCNKPLSV